MVWGGVRIDFRGLCGLVLGGMLVDWSYCHCDPFDSL